MCVSVHISSNAELQEISIDDSNWQIHVEKIDEHDFRFYDQFSIKYNYYIGSHTGCGCGFIRDHKLDLNDEFYRKEHELTETDIDELIKYLKTGLSKTKEILMFTFWENEIGGFEPEERQTIHPEELKNIDLKMDTEIFIVI